MFPVGHLRQGDGWSASWRWLRVFDEGVALMGPHCVLDWCDGRYMVEVLFDIYA